jgi:hypothetical protein
MPRGRLCRALLGLLKLLLGILCSLGKSVTGFELRAMAKEGVP